MADSPGQFRRLLVVCSDLRADSLAGSLRVRAFIKYLSRGGWHVTAVTTAADPGPPAGADASRVDIRVVPAASGGPRWRRAWRRVSSAPDPFAQWLPAGWRAVLDVVGERRPDVVLVSTPPHSLQGLGVRLRREHGLPYVADFRDDWMTNHRQKWPTPWHRWVGRRREAECVATAGRVLLNTAEVHRRFVARHPSRAGTMSVLTNGYDEEDFAADSPAVPAAGGRLRIYYAGASYGDYMDTQLGRLADDLVSAGLGDRWEIVSLGAGSWRGTGRPPVWRHLGTLDGAGAARELEQAAVLLLPMPPGEREPSGTVPLKAYGYLRSGRSVVYLGERGSTSELLGRFAGTHCLGRSGWDGLAAWLEAHRDGLGRRHERAGIGEYGFGQITRRLEQHLLEVIREDRNPKQP